MVNFLKFFFAFKVNIYLQNMSMKSLLVRFDKQMYFCWFFCVFFCWYAVYLSCFHNRNGGVMVSVLTLWVRAPVGLNQRFQFGICCFSAKHTALRRKSKNWLARNQNNVSEWCDMSTRVLLFQ